MNILVVAAHPDDEILGCGGTIAKLSKNNDVSVLILGEGITSRNLTTEQKLNGLNDLRRDASDANKILGVKHLYFEQFPDNKFDSVPLLDIVKLLETYLKKINPHTIYTHHPGDLNIDHQLTNRAVFTAARPLGNSDLKEIYFFEILSSTEWGLPNSISAFIPNVYVDILETIELKLQAMESYKSEIKEYPHSRSCEGIRILAQKRGMDVGLKFAEAFFSARCIR